MMHGHVHADIHTHAGIHGSRRRWRRWSGSCSRFIVAGSLITRSTRATSIAAHVVATTALEDRVADVRCLVLGLLLVLLVLRVHLAMVVGIGRDEHLVGMDRVGERSLVRIAGGEIVGGAAGREGEEAGQRINVQRRQTGECGGHLVGAPVAVIPGGASSSTVVAAPVAAACRRCGADLDVAATDAHAHSDRGIEAAAAVEVTAGERGDGQGGAALAG